MAKNKFRRGRSIITRHMWDVAEKARTEGSVQLTYGEIRALITKLESSLKTEKSHAYTAGSISSF